MKQYLDFMRHVRDTGNEKTDRTGTGTTSSLGYLMRFDLEDGFPLVTTKKVHLKSIVHELIWFLAGDTNIKYLKDNGVGIWDEWADEDGELGPVYGAQWREHAHHKVIPLSVEGMTQKQIDKASEKHRKALADGWVKIGVTDDGKGAMYQKKIDQIKEAINLLKNNPDSRRIIISSWNVAELSEMKLMPCHALFQFYVVDMTVLQRMELALKNGKMTTEEISKRQTPFAHEDMDMLGIPRKRLSCELYQRSADIFLGVPFNIASYALLTHMVAQQLDMAVGEFVWVGGDCHLYSNHADQTELQLSRETRTLPKLVIKRKPNSLFDYKFEDFELEGYDPHPGIRAQVAV